MASFKYDIRLNSNQVAAAIVQETKEILGRTIDQLRIRIRPDLVNYVEKKLKQYPSNTYYSLNFGELQRDFGFMPGENVAEQVVKTISSSIQLSKLGPTSVSLGGFRLEILKEGIQSLLNKGFAAYDSNGNTVDWLRWLLTAGDTIVVADYQVMKDKGTPLSSSRSGYALMISPKMSKGFRVDPNHSGTIDDNWITRALFSAQQDIVAKLLTGLRGLL
jgi:hypothetical protein